MPCSTISAVAAALVAVLGSIAHGFSIAPPPAALKKIPSMQFSPTALGAIRCYDKYYQLEEMEDQDSCTTELFLTADGGVEFGDTDGPVFTNAVGNWEVAPGTDDFTMYITRKFSTGKDNTDVGEFSFETTRTFVGEMTMVGASVAISGVTRSKDTSLMNDEEIETGYFNMIDATEERLGDDKKGVEQQQTSRGSSSY